MQNMERNNMKLLKTIFILSLLLLGSFSYAEYTAKGWAWYNEPEEESIERPAEQEQIIVQQVVETQPMTSREKLQQFKDHYEELQAEAVINPTPKNVAKAMQMRKFMYDQSYRYSNAHQEALLMYPELSHQMKFPTQDAAREIYGQQQDLEKVNAAKILSKDFGLIFFYKGADPYSKKMAPIIRSFQKRYDFALIGVTMDGIALTDIPNNQENTGQAKLMGVKAFPALFIVNPKTKKAIPLSYGFVTQDQILERMYQLLSDYGRKEITLED